MECALILSPVKIGQKIAFWGIRLKCKILFSEPPKATSFRETTTFHVLIVKIGAGGLAAGRRKTKKIAESLEAHFSVFGGERG